MVTTRPNSHSYIIKRPRLTRLLDESEARIILLCAPAGYGKTTLAREWVASKNLPVAWYSGGSEMLDAASLTVGIAESLQDAGLLSGADEVASLAGRTQRPMSLVRAIVGALSAGKGGLLVIDDYHYACESERSEQIIEGLAAESHLSLLVTSRLRPSWLTAREQVYGNALVIGVDALAFTDEEAISVLETSETNATSGLLEVAQGWPAIVGLAALQRQPRAPVAGDVLSDELFDYLASDLVDSVQRAVRELVFVAALCGGRTDDVVAQVIPNHRGKARDASRRGLLSVRRGGALEVHPLIRELVISKLLIDDPASARAIGKKVVRELARVKSQDVV
jgi:LuxR family maltose regulon positive regulatory protein